MLAATAGRRCPTVSCPSTGATGTREAVAAAVGWALADAIAAPPAVIAITQQANVRSRRLLESIGMDLVESLVEFDVPQVMYSVDRIGLQSAANPLGRP